MLNTYLYEMRIFNAFHPNYFLLNHFGLRSLKNSCTIKLKFFHYQNKIVKYGEVSNTMVIFENFKWGPVAQSGRALGS